MAQFTVHKNANPATKSAIPYLLDVQSNLIDALSTRVVVPLYPVTALKRGALATLTPVFEVDGESLVMMTPQLAGVPSKALGSAVTDLSAYREQIMAALDFLITGI